MNAYKELVWYSVDQNILFITAGGFQDGKDSLGIYAFWYGLGQSYLIGELNK